MSKIIRSFIAIELPVEIKVELGFVIQALKENIPDGIRWIPVDNIHLTLKFLGDVKEEHLDSIKNAIKISAISTQPVNIFLKKVGAFPNIHKPHVIWLGLDAPENLAELIEKINKSTEVVGYPTEKRPFSPHLTLGRVSKYINTNEMKRIVDFLSNNKLESKTAGILTSVVLYRSDLTPHGANYSKLFFTNLTKS